MLASSEASATTCGELDPSREGDIGPRQLAGVLGADERMARKGPEGGACQDDEEMDSLLLFLPRLLLPWLRPSCVDEPNREPLAINEKPVEAFELFCNRGGRLRSPEDFSSAAT